MARNLATKRKAKDETVDGLTREEAEELLAIEEELAGAGETLREFIARVAPEHCPIPRHLEPLIDAIERARYERVRVCLSMPPGHAKTLTILRAIAWWLRATPEDTCAYVSYNNHQAWDKSKGARDIALQAGVELDPRFQSGARWRTTVGGGLRAAGIDGTLTGQRVTGFAIFDDPFKSRTDANSAAKREEVWSFYTTVIRTRLENASVIVVHTRWHQDDLIGRLAKKDGWEVINLPAIADNDNGTPDRLGRKAGEALWPEMYPANDLLDTKAEIGEFDFAALYQGQPRARGATIFGLEHYYDPAKFDISECRIVLACDPAATDSDSSDYGAIAVLAMRGEGINTYAYVLDFYREQVTIPQFTRDARAWQERYGNPKMAVESNGAFAVVPQLLREANPKLRVKPIIALGDKFQRAQPVAAAWNAGRVLVPLGAPKWLADFLAEVSVFIGVNDAHDDQVDALSHAWNTGYRKGGGGSLSDEPLGARRI